MILLISEISRIRFFKFNCLSRLQCYFFSSSVVLRIKMFWPLILCILGNFHVIVIVCRLFSKLTFFKTYFSNTSRVLNGFDPIRTNVILVLIWIQIVCQGYQQTTESSLAKKVKLMDSLLTIQF